MPRTAIAAGEMTPTRRILGVAQLTFVACLILCVLSWYSVVSVLWREGVPPAMWAANMLQKILVLFAVSGVTAVVLRRLAHSDMALQRMAAAQDRFIRACAGRRLDIGIAVTAALGLLLELALIRWYGAMFPVFAFYKNLNLLAAFLGLGLGYAMSGRKQIPIVLVTPLLAWQFFVIQWLRYGPRFWDTVLLKGAPTTEQVAMGLAPVQWTQELVLFGFLVTVFSLQVLTLLPLGQLCGSLMNRRPQLRAYGLNLLGSLLGVLAMHFLAREWTPPVIWFGIAIIGLALVQVFSRKAMATCLVAGALGLIALTWPSKDFVMTVDSPYQRLEVFLSGGHIELRAAGHYYQRIHDFSKISRDHSDAVAWYYELPYRIRNSTEKVAIVGAGTGNDVAAALRMGVEEIDAVEIDEAILELGIRAHPEHPYWSDKVRPVVDDARSFFRTTPRVYDAIVYGLLDSHTVISQNSSVRLDSFVYTVEGFRDARARLAPGGLLSLSFSIMTLELGRKLYLMLNEAFDNCPPRVLRSQKDGGVVFLSAETVAPTVPLGMLVSGSFSDVTEMFADASIQADVSTDDWPFFYMPRRVFPVRYVVVLLVVILLSLFLVVRIFGQDALQRPGADTLTAFLLGAGFMLVETKAITELGLVFGNTWEVVAIAIAGVLIMAFAANSLVHFWRPRPQILVFVLLVASIGLGLAVARMGGLGATFGGRLGTVALLTLPLLFSGLCFSSLIANTSNLAGIMASNIFGAMLGGMLEYNAMYFGFASLYILAMALYLLAAVAASLVRRPSGPA
ncbi:MAG: hypothetical protein ABIJ09_08710 [Pseudomonadota bacterium]